MGNYFWCAACGNPDIIIESSKSGYSVKKGLVGAAILGPVGAVAGLDGKESNSYYCPKCGAKLNQCMPDFEVCSILQMLSNPDESRRMLEEKRNKYPNMLWPKIWDMNDNMEESVEEVKIEANDFNLSEMTEDDFMEAIVTALKKVGHPLPVEEVKKSIIGERVYNNVFSHIPITYSSGEKKAYKQGTITNSIVEGVLCYRLAKNKEEQLNLSYEYEAFHERFELYKEKGYFQEAIRIILEEGPISKLALIDKLTTTFPDINSTNPYSARACSIKAISHLEREKKVFENEQGLYSAISALEKESAIIEEYKKTIEWSTTNEMKDRGWEEDLKVMNYLENNPGSTASLIAGGTGMVSVRLTLRYLQERGEVKSEGRGGTARWYKSYISEEEKRARAYNKVLKEHRDRMTQSAVYGFKLDDLKKVLKKAEDYIESGKIVDVLTQTGPVKDQSVYKALYILQVFGEAKNEKRDGTSYWCIVDEEIERKKRVATYWEMHVDEHNSLIQEQKELNEKNEKAKQRREEAIKKGNESRSRQKEIAVEEKVYKELQDRIASLRREQASLGFFKRKEKRRIQVQIDDLLNEEDQKKQDAEEVRKRIDDVEQKIQNESDALFKQACAEIEDYDKRLSEIEAELTRDREV